MTTDSNQMRQPKKPSLRHKGFSLVEVLVILVIIAILGGISGMALFKWLPQANLKRAARTIVSMCQDARVEAIKRNSQVSLNCTGNLCIVRLEDSTQFRRFDLSTLQSGVHLTNTFYTNFNSRGRSSAAGSLTIQNNAGNSLTVRVRTSGSIVTN